MALDQPGLQYTLTLLFLLGLSAALSAAETALFSLTAEQVATLAGRSPRAGIRLEGLLSRPRRTLLTLRLCDTLINLASAATALGLAALLAPGWAWLGPFLLIPVLVLLGELFPRFVAAARPLPIARAVALPLSLLVATLTPLRRLLRQAAEALLLRVGVAGGPGVTEEEVRGLLEAGTAAGVMAPGERDMIRRALAFGQARVRDVMTPRADMFCLEASLSLPEAVAAVRRANFSRVPVYQESLDRIVGILHARDLLKAGASGAAPPLTGILRPALFVPETKRAEDLLAEFRRRRRHMAIVVDEYGGTAGLVTLEDVLEELVGEISDEFDEAVRGVTSLGRGRARIPAGMSIAEFNERFGASLPSDGIQTVGGFVFDRLGKLPGRGDAVRFGPFRFVVEMVRGARLTELIVEQAEEAGHE